MFDYSQADLDQSLEKYGDGLLRLCFLYLRDYALAEDAVQTTYLKYYLHKDKFRGEASEKTYLSSIAVNVCRNMLRSPWRKRMLPLDNIDLPDPRQTMPDGTVTRAVMQLPPKLREVVALHYLQGFKVAETAQILEISTEAAASRLNRARKELRTALKEWYYGE